MGRRVQWNARATGSLAVAAVVVAAGLVVFGHGNTHTVTGELSLDDSSYQGVAAGSGCSGQNGYDDIEEGTEVKIKDEAGRLIATGHLEAGTFDGLYCVFPFAVSSVPHAKYYDLSTGNSLRDGVHYTEQELKSHHWAAHLASGT